MPIVLIQVVFARNELKESVKEGLKHIASIWMYPVDTKLSRM